MVVVVLHGSCNSDDNDVAWRDGGGSDHVMIVVDNRSGDSSTLW